MTAEQLNAAATVGTLVVLGASAIAALTQLRHMRTTNQLQAVLSLQQEFRAPEMQMALRYVQRELASKLSDAKYRAGLERIGFIDQDEHPEIVLCNWFNELGTLLKFRFATEDAFMDLFGRLIAHYWKLLEPVVAIMRRSRGGSQYHDFEYLASRAQAWMARHPEGYFPSGTSRLSLSDPWREIDARGSSLTPE